MSMLGMLIVVGSDPRSALPILLVLCELCRIRIDECGVGSVVRHRLASCATARRGYQGIIKASPGNIAFVLAPSAYLRSSTAIAPLRPSCPPISRSSRRLSRAPSPPQRPNFRTRPRSHPRKRRHHLPQASSRRHHHRHPHNQTPTHLQRRGKEMLRQMFLSPSRASRATVRISRRTWPLRLTT